MHSDLLKSIANTETWENIKDVLNDYILEIKDVTKPLNVSEFKIDAREAYLAKVLTAIKFQEFINSIDIYKSNKPIKIYEKDLFI